MGYYDYIMKASEKVKQSLFDENIKIQGREVAAVRLSTNEDIFHDITDEKVIYDNDSLISVIIRFPDEIPIDRIRYSATVSEVADTRIFFMDLLPIEAFSKLNDNIEKNDLLFFFLNDEKGNRIPILLQVVEVFGKFETSMIWKRLNLAPYHGALSKDAYNYIQESIDPPGEKSAPLITQEQPVSDKIVRETRAEEFMKGN